MKHRNLGPKRLVLMAALGAAVFIFSSWTRAAQTGLPIYYEDSTLLLQPAEINRTTYLPLLEIVTHLQLPYTDALALETFTIRNGTSRLVLTRNSGLISINDQIVLLRNPVLRENDRWLVPIDFLTLGLSRLTGTEYRYRTGTSRIFAGNVQAPELVMNAQGLGPITRLTIRVGAPVNISINRDDPSRTVLTLNRAPVDPLREALDHKDPLVDAISFDDSDGTPRIIINTTGDVADVRATPAQGNEVYFIDFSRAQTTQSEPAAAPPPVSAPPDPRRPLNRVRVVVIDPGHGGIDVGAERAGILEKELTLAMARRLRAALESRLGATVLLTRDSDIDLPAQSRAAVANNNQANVFISLHVGHSTDALETGSSVFVMKNAFGGPAVPTSAREPLFLPWYLAYLKNRSASMDVANMVGEELSRVNPGWEFTLREAPLAVLASAAMPAVAIEIGNINNEVNAQTLQDVNFQNRLAATIAGALQRFSTTPSSGVTGN